jgi:hypothetical protein
MLAYISSLLSICGEVQKVGVRRSVTSQERVATGKTAEEVGGGCWRPGRFTVVFFCDICDSCGDFVVFYIPGVNVSIWLG